MKYLFPILLFTMVCTIIQCKSKATVDPVLLEASEIQHDAIHIGDELESMLKDAMAKDTSADGKDKYNVLLTALKDWQNNMVEIPGIEHDHDHGHHNHDHSHKASDAAAHLTPEEMKQVQIEWKNAVIALKEAFN